MAGYNSVPSFFTARAAELLEAAGITQFPSETNWFHTIYGLLIQGGFIDNAATGTTITLNASFPKQVLGIWVQSVGANAPGFYISAVTTDNFVINYTGGGTKDFYWFAIGV